MALNDQFATLVKDEVKAQLDPFLGLMKSLEAPAKKAGVSPQQLFSQMTDGGRIPGVLTPDGRWAPVPAALNKREQKAMGWGAYLRDMAVLANPDAIQGTTKEAQVAAYNRVTGGHYGAVEKAALAEGSGVTGGYLVPPQFSETLMSIAAENAVIAPRATVLPMTGMTLQVPALDHTGTTAGQSPFLGGVVARWESENRSRTETEPTFRQTELKAWELSFYTLASNNLLADNAVALDSLLTTIFSKAIEWYTDYAYLQGDGVGKPLGIINCPCTVAITRGTSSRIRWVDVVTMRSKLLADSWSRAIWVAHQSTFVDLSLMHDSQGNQTGFGAGRPVWIGSDGGMAKSPPETLLGRPIYYTEKVPLLGSKGDLMLIDPFYYLIGQRMSLEIAVSAHSAFLTNQMTWRVVFRGDGRPWLPGAITLADGSHTVSPFVAIAA